MKQKLLLILAITFGMTLQMKAEVVEMQSTNPTDTHKEGPRNIVPTVTTDCEMISINADTVYYGALVVVKNSQGEVIKNEFINISTNPQTIRVTDTDRKTIEIFCGKESFFGIFND